MASDEEDKMPSDYELSGSDVSDEDASGWMEVSVYNETNVGNSEFGEDKQHPDIKREAEEDLHAEGWIAATTMNTSGKKRRRSEVWSLIETLSGGKVKCVLCGSALNGGRTSNIWRHIRRVHKDIATRDFGEYENQDQTVRRNGIKKVSALKKAKRQRRLFLLGVATSSAPLSIGENYFMQEFFKSSSLETIPRNEMEAGILRENRFLMRKIKQVLPTSEKVSISINISTTRNISRSYLNIIAHFILPDSPNIDRVLLDVICLEEKRDAWYIQEQAFNVLNSYGLRLEDVHRIVGDNAANMKCAFSGKFFSKIHVGDDQLCAPIAGQGTDLEGELSEVGESLTEPPDDDYDDLLDGFNSISTQYLSSPIHSLMLVMRDGFEKTESAKRLKNAVFSTVWRYVNSYLLNQELMQRTGKRLEFPGEARWLNLLATYRRFLKVVDSVSAINVENGEEPIKDEVLLQARMVVELLEKFEEVVIKWQQKVQPTISKVFPALLYLEKHLTTFAKTNPHFSSLSTTLLTALKNNFDAVFKSGTSKGEPFYIAATFLDPRQHKYLRHYPHATRTVDSLIKSLYGSQSAPATVRQARNGEFDELLSEDDDSPVDDEITHYLGIMSSQKFSRNFDVIDFWNKHQAEMPNLTELACKILAIPAGSAEVERFSYNVALNTTDCKSQTERELMRARVMLSYNASYVTL